MRSRIAITSFVALLLVVAYVRAQLVFPGLVDGLLTELQ
jgi:hypothetical protein